MSARASKVGGTQLTLSSHFTRHARYFASERIELIHHRVDGVLQIEDFALYSDNDLSRQVALCNRSGGQVLPDAGNAFHAGLAPELAFSSHFTRHARYFGRRTN